MPGMEPTDGELLTRWRAGDSASGEALFERYYDSVERFFFNKVGREIADLAQETFVRCIESREQIPQQEDRFRLYLFGIAYHVLNRHLRLRYRGGELLDSSEVSIRDIEPGPATLAGQRQNDRLLLEGLRSIPVDDQVILELHYWEELTTDDIAEVLAIPVGTARGRLQRAREKLTEQMTRLTESPWDLESTFAGVEDWAEALRGQLAERAKSP